MVPYEGSFGGVPEDLLTNDTLLKCRDTRAEHVASRWMGEIKIFAATMMLDVDFCCIGTREGTVSQHIFHLYVSYSLSSPFEITWLFPLASCQSAGPVN